MRDSYYYVCLYADSYLVIFVIIQHEALSRHEARQNLLWHSREEVFHFYKRILNQFVAIAVWVVGSLQKISPDYYRRVTSVYVFVSPSQVAPSRTQQDMYTRWSLQTNQPK